MNTPILTPPPRIPVLMAENLARAGFRHGFAVRVGGVSEGAFWSLNFGNGDDPAHVAENVRRFAVAVGFEPAALRQVTQVHGARVVDARTLGSAASREEADALVLPGGPGAAPSSNGYGLGQGAGTGDAARAVGVRVADCVPILVGARASGAVAAIHAGWRGVVAGVIGAALGRLDAIAGGATRGASDRVAAIGPCIGPRCFEVGADIAAQIAEACGDPTVVVSTHEDKAHVDLRRAVRAQLARFGVTDVEDVPGCTRCEKARFFSFRRDGDPSGRHLAAIMASESRL